jgi:predicted transcriptional regulator
MDRRSPFRTASDVAAYVAGDTIQCLECGGRFRSLAAHLQRAHQMRSAEYRAQWGLPRQTPLMGRALREAHRAVMRANIQDGRIDQPAHAARVRPLANQMPSRRGSRAPAAQDARRRGLAAIRDRADPRQLPSGARRASGDDADHKRAYQRAYRALQRGDPEPMARYRAHRQSPPET